MSSKPLGWTDMWGKAALAVGKGVIGWFTGSKALMADALRSGADSAESFASLTGLRSTKAARARTLLRGSGRAVPAPRAEAAASILLSVLLLIIGIETAVFAIRDLADGVSSAPHWGACAAALIGLLLQQLLLNLHPYRMGLYVSLAAVIGSGAATLGKWIEVPELYYMDPAASLVIACLLLYSGWRTAAAEAFKESGEASSERDVDELMQLIQRVDGVVTVEMLRAKEQGHYVIADIIITVNPRITVIEGHEIARRAKQLLLKRFLHVTDVTIHVEPYSPNYPYKSNHDPNQEHTPTLLQ
ncbi:cation diffusion facilitator family transporter [Paenibacillus sp. GCM10023252]|uniref:cation diffusion facilitator family transporter n=1 Tax=Paenibacillus sp. GCM10023252 TaxID=3252649 RepID=UPI00360C81A2